MFEIGNSLREARQRQGLDLTRVEDATKIRGKYLQALEDERFDILPAETYVKGFLRTYAEYLGLDGQIYVDEFNSRFASADDAPVAATPPPRSRRRASESSFVVVALAGIVAVAILVVVAFTLSNDDGSGDAGSRLAETSAPTPPPASGSGGATSAPQQTTARLVLRAARGPCWVEVRRNAADGELLFAGTIERGRSMRFTGKRLWLVFGNAPSENLDVRLNGRRVESFPVGEPVVIASSRGVRAQPSA